MDIPEKLQERRIVTLNDKINWDQADKIRQKLLELELESNGEILLLIDSGGGDTQPGFSICDLISCLEAPVTAVVVGRCYSMAVVILQACGKRLALKHATFFLHFISTGFHFSHHLSDEDVFALFERRMLEGKDSQIKSEQCISARTGKSVEDVRKLMHDGDNLDTRLNAEEAKAFGLIEKIVEDPKGLFTKRP